jgi:glucokinase
MSNALLLAGDIGATKTTLAIVSAKAGPRSPLAEVTFPSARYSSLETLVHDFLAAARLNVDRASFAVAGPVVAGRAQLTNLPWMIDEAELAKDLNLRSIELLNDVQATAYAVPALEPNELHILNEGQPEPQGNVAVIAPGTGLGEGFLTWEGSSYRAHASEGGHVDFAPSNELEIELLRYLQERVEHVSYEWVCSGLGLPHIYAFLKESGHAREPLWLAERLTSAEDPTPLIVNAALDPDESCKLCVATLDLFISVLGAEAGNLALKVLATGGVYLGGGIPPRILPGLANRKFMEAFQRKGRRTDLLAQMPVQVILNPKAALLGAAQYGLERRDATA